MSNFTPTVASMFAGIGGICSGFIQAGFSVVWANEINSAACKTYRHNFGDKYLVEKDIREVNTDSLPNFDILAAGFPCQSFSIGGSQNGFNDNRGILFFEVDRIIKACRPKVVFLENVENLVEHDNGHTFNVIFATLAQHGYCVRYKVMPTNEYANIPQARKRIYIVAFLDYDKSDKFCYPTPVQLKTSIADIVDTSEEKKRVYYYNLNTDLGKRLSTFVSAPSKLYRVYNGQARNTKYPDICPTITASMNSIYNAIALRDEWGIRRLTLRETLDFQGFPQDFYFPKTVSLSEAYKQIGNSVSVPLVKRVASQIRALF